MTGRRLISAFVLLTALAVGVAAYASLSLPEGAGDRDARLQMLVESYLGDRAGKHGVAVYSLDDGRAAWVNAERPFLAASLFKLLVMYRVYDRSASGQLALDGPLTITDADAVEGEPVGGLAPGQTVTVRRALEALITVSSNSAAYALARAVGGWEEIRSVPAELGMRRTWFEDYWWSTPADLQRFFRLLAERHLVSGEASDEMLQLLTRQTRNDRIPALLPPVVSVAHKTGELHGVRNDGGVVQGPGAHYVLVIMSEDADPARATETQALLSRLIYDYYTSREGG